MKIDQYLTEFPLIARVFPVTGILQANHQNYSFGRFFITNSSKKSFL